jgi:hypothetical protein
MTTRPKNPLSLVMFGIPLSLGTINFVQECGINLTDYASAENLDGKYLEQAPRRCDNNVYILNSQGRVLYERQKGMPHEPMTDMCIEEIAEIHHDLQECVITAFDSSAQGQPISYVNRYAGDPFVASWFPYYGNDKMMNDLPLLHLNISSRLDQDHVTFLCDSGIPL